MFCYARVGSLNYNSVTESSVHGQQPERLLALNAKAMQLLTVVYYTTKHLEAFLCGIRKGLIII